jgi:acyl-coenzyme A synthetase/AMP-(fatty) acid ligase
VIATAGVDVVVTDRPRERLMLGAVERVVSCGQTIRHAVGERKPEMNTEWILFTSGTTGVPKMVVHTLASLTGAITPSKPHSDPAIWATFYDIRRYGGLQILLRSVTGGSSLVLSSPGEDPTSFLMRARDHRVTHISGTPSHWRRALLSSALRSLSPRYVRLSGEIADQNLIDQLRATLPEAEVAHAFASTEAGVAFEVTDGRAGFPTSFLGRPDGDVRLEVVDETLRIGSARTARRYLGGHDERLFDANGFVDTGDVIDQREDRCYFIGRRGGIINVGGLKIHPEEVEAVINRHPRVRMSRVTGRRSPIVGAIVVADVVLDSSTEHVVGVAAGERTRAEILESCRRSLASHKVPASIRFTTALPVTASGKLERCDA